MRRIWRSSVGSERKRRPGFEDGRPSTRDPDRHLMPTGDAGGLEGRVAVRPLLAVILSAVFVSVMTQSLINVVVPVIGEDFGASEGQVGWVITGYLLVFAVGIPLYGRISDLYSLRRTFSLGILGLAAGSVVCALAPNLPVLGAGRILQAAGSSAIPGLG